MMEKRCEGEKDAEKKPDPDAGPAVDRLFPGMASDKLLRLPEAGDDGGPTDRGGRCSVPASGFVLPPGLALVLALVLAPVLGMALAPAWWPNTEFASAPSPFPSPVDEPAKDPGREAVVVDCRLRGEAVNGEEAIPAG